MARATCQNVTVPFFLKIRPIPLVESSYFPVFTQAYRAGRVLDLGDALIAGTAKAHELALATRNASDFGSLDLDVVNPWGTP